MKTFASLFSNEMKLMSQKKSILMLTNFIIIALLVSNAITSIAIEREYNAGNIFTWGFNIEEVMTNTYLDLDLVYINDETDSGDIQLNITAIDTLTKNYEGIWSDDSGSGSPGTYDYSLDDLGDRFETGDLFDIDWEWDYLNNVTVPGDFDFMLNTPYLMWQVFDHSYLIDPKWGDINDAIFAGFNLTYQVETFYNPYNANITYNYTLADVFDNISFKIMGKDTLADAEAKFTDTIYKWNFVFDLSGFLMEEYWNGTTDIYQAYETYIVSLSLEYSEGGVLQELEHTTTTLITIDGIQEEVNYKFKLALGGMKSATVNFATISAVIGLFTISIVIVVIRRRKR